jgi:hypothetical protein
LTALAARRLSPDRFAVTLSRDGSRICGYSSVASPLAGEVASSSERVRGLHRHKRIGDHL